MKKANLVKIQRDIESGIYFATNKKNSVFLHTPLFHKNEIKNLKYCIQSTYVSTAGKFIREFELKLESFTKAKNIIAVLNGTIGLTICIKVLGAKRSDEILVPTLTFVGTVNAIKNADCNPHFIDSDKEGLGIDYYKLEIYLKKNTYIKNNYLYNKKTKNRIFAIIPVHILGNINNINNVCKIAKKFKLKIIEDAAEALGSFYKKKHAGTFGDLGVISFNANKTITTGGGGAIICNNNRLSNKIRHLISVSKKPHKWKFIHDSVGWNYKMTNLNAAVGLGQMFHLKKILLYKKRIHNKYNSFFKNNIFIKVLKSSLNCKSNYWINAIYVENININERDFLLSNLNKKSIECRPLWKLIHTLPMYKNCQKSSLNNSIDLEKKIICLPSSPIYGKL